MTDIGAALAPQDAALMKSVSSLREHLSACFDAVKCVVCQESLSAAQQLECCHALCKPCLDKSMEVMPKVDRGRSPCPVCRFPINKRVIQDAPLPIAQIVAAFERLDFLITDAQQSLHDDKPPPESMPPPPTTPPPSDIRPVHDVSRPASSHSTPANSKHSPGSTYPVSACAFCPRGVDPSTVAPGAEMGPLCPLSAPGTTKSTLRVHEECGFFAENVYARAGQFVNAEKALRKAKKELCRRDACGRKGAAVVCVAEDCNARYHYVCALAADCVVLLDGSYSMFCPSHIHLAPKLDMDDFVEHQIDPNGSQAQHSADICLTCGKGGELVLCDDCDRACHLVCAGLAAIPRGKWICGICAGTHEMLMVESENQAGSVALPASPPPSSRSEHRKRKVPSTPLQVLQSLSSNTLRQRSSSGCKSVEKRKAVTYKRRRRSGESIVILPTGLNGAQTSMLDAARKKHKGVFSVASDFSKRVTHVLVNAFTPGDTPKRTLKLCKCIAANLPVVCFKWVDDAVSNTVPPSLAEYMHKTSRAGLGADGLFQGQRFFVGFKDQNGMVPAKQDISQLIQLGGGTIMTHQPTAAAAVQECGKVFYVRAKEGINQQNERRLSQLQTALQLPAGCEVIDHDWLLDKCMLPS